MNTYGLTLDSILARCTPGEGDCLIWKSQFGGSRFPYPIISRNRLDSGKRGSVGVRRIAFFLAKGKSLVGLYVYMKCNDTRCLNPEHMVAKSRRNVNEGPRRKDHAARAAEGRRRSPATKLDWEKARAIRARLAEGKKGQDIALEFGVSKHMISRIKVGKAWAERSPFSGLGG